MQVETPVFDIVYVLTHEYWKESFGQGSWRKSTSSRLFALWNGRDDFEKVLRKANPKFRKQVKNVTSNRNHQIEIVDLRLGGEKGIIISVERQIFQLIKNSA